MKFGEWEIWHGGKCPVDDDVIVEIVYRDRHSFADPERKQAGNLLWMHRDSPVDIMAYRVLEAEPESVWFNIFETSPSELFLGMPHKTRENAEYCAKEGRCVGRVRVKLEAGRWDE